MNQPIIRFAVIGQVKKLSLNLMRPCSHLFRRGFIFSIPITSGFVLPWLADSKQMKHDCKNHSQMVKAGEIWYPLSKFYGHYGINEYTWRCAFKLPSDIALYAVVFWYTSGTVGNPLMFICVNGLGFLTGFDCYRVFCTMNFPEIDDNNKVN